LFRVSISHDNGGPIRSVKTPETIREVNTPARLAAWVGAILVLISLSSTFAGSSIFQGSTFKATRSRAAGGDVLAQFELGRIYEFGDGVTADSAKAVPQSRREASGASGI
jgi:TPR repeat protein